MSKVANSTRKNSSVQVSRPSRQQQKGVGLIEVMVAMFILAFGALAIVNLQTASAVAVQGSADHFKINELGLVIAEQVKIDTERASNGAYNTVFADETAPTNAPDDIEAIINEWKATMARSTPNGETQIDCDDEVCDISLRWNGNVQSDDNSQVFNIRTPI